MSTRVAVITDIHSNGPALQSALEAIDAQGVDALYCGGDLVGYGPHVNCGSVGKPKDGDPRASYAVLAGTDTGVAVSIERVPYDTLAVAREMRKVGLPEELADKLVIAA